MMTSSHQRKAVAWTNQLVSRHSNKPAWTLVAKDIPKAVTQISLKVCHLDASNKHNTCRLPSGRTLLHTFRIIEANAPIPKM